MIGNGDTRATTSHLDLDEFPDNGCAHIGPIIDPGSCAELRSWIDRTRPLKRSIFFQTHDEFREKGRWQNFAPGRKEHNLLTTENPDLRFIEENPKFVQMAERLAGKNYGIMKKSVIRSVPQKILPPWLSEYVSDLGRPNLNPYIRDECQDIQHFLRIDFHQDKTRPESDFVTVYIYLEEVDEANSPLRILTGSHKLGLTQYPHILRRTYSNESNWFYSDTIGNHEKCLEAIVTGSPGTVLCFHCLALHGTGPNEGADPRISLRYLLKKDPESQDTLLDQANRQIYGPLRRSKVRLDVGPDGMHLPTGSSLIAGR